MMELLVRIANEKYIDRMKATTRMDEALVMFWDDHLEEVMGEPTNTYLEMLDKWRWDHYYNEFCDYCM